MISWIYVVILGISSVVGEIPPGCAADEVARPGGDPCSRNLFGEWLGKSDSEIDTRIQGAFQQLFYGDDANERLYYPVGEDMAYIWDVASNDVRSEGMSYGMMIAVQMDRQEEFDRLWKWAHTYMRHADGPRKGYFAWQCATDGSQIDPGSASDGELWIAMSLFLASGRWGDGDGIFDYRAEANALLEAMLNADRSHDDISSMFDLNRKVIRFVPLESWAGVTDPSYQLPSFLECFAQWADEDRAFWAEAAEAAREMLRKSAHPETGLMPDYSDFEGKPYVLGGHEDFRFDAWRTLANVAMDHVWFGKDPWQLEQSARVLGFLGSFGPQLPNQFTVDGKPLSEQPSPGLFAMAAVGSQAVDRETGLPFVQYLWDAPTPTGLYRYYDGLLVLMGLIHVSGDFCVYAPDQDEEASCCSTQP